MLASTSRVAVRKCEVCGQSLARRTFSLSSVRTLGQPKPPIFTTSNRTSPSPSSTTPLRSQPQELPAYGNQPNATFSWWTVTVFISTGIGLWIYFDHEKKRVKQSLERQRATRSVGKADIGGPFTMQTTDTKAFTERDLLGRFHLIYFGFTNCPDVCPEELDKIGGAVDAIRAKHGKESIRPIFVSVDPARDTPEAMKKYLRDFHPDIIGLVGEYDDVKQMCKRYRVYFSTPPDTKPGDDYLVDHSIFFYLMSPEGHFVDAFGKIFSKDEVVEKVDFYIKEYKDGTRWGGIQDITYS